MRQTGIEETIRDGRKARASRGKPLNGGRNRIPSRFPLYVLALALAVLLSLGVPYGSLAVVTSDAWGTHLTVDGTKIDLSSQFPPGEAPPLLDHDSVGKLEFFRPDYGETFCSSAVINTPLGRAALTAGHCLVDTSGNMIAGDFSLTILDSLGYWQTFTTNDSQNVYVHPNYDGWPNRGYDLAIVFFDQIIDAWTTAYEVAADSTALLGTDNRVVKFGFGRTGDGVSQPELDGLKRWGLNSYEFYGLGQFGLQVPGGWNNLETQVTSDFDDYPFRFGQHDFFNYYENFIGFVIFPDLSPGGTLGWQSDEVFGSNGDSGGPNFLYDAEQGWIIVAVNSYRYQTPPGTLGRPGTPDVNPNYWSTYGEYEGDAVVTEGLVEQVLGIAPPPPMGKPFGTGMYSRYLNSGGPLGPAK